MFGVNNITAWQFTFFRIVFGLYLTWHLDRLLYFGPEIYSSAGMLPDASANPTFGLFPSIFWISDSPTTVTIVLLVLMLCSALFTVGYGRRVCAVIIWFGLACLFNRNVLTSNPSLPYVGLILILSVMVPVGEPLSFRGKENFDWRFPRALFWVAWILLAVGYTFSGVVKLQSPSWVNGDAMRMLLENPLARPGWIRDLFLVMPPFVLKLMTWSVLALEIVFLPLSAFSKGRAWAWTLMLGMHVGIVLMIDFADLSLGMIMIHLFTFDPAWLKPVRDGRLRIIFYDGECGLCDSSIRFFMKMDTEGMLRYAPLQGSTALEQLPEELRSVDQLDTLVYAVIDQGQTVETRVRSEAVFSALKEVGGLGRIMSWIGILPTALCDFGYRLMARNRHRFWKKENCRLPTPEERARMLA